MAVNTDVETVAPQLAKPLPEIEWAAIRERRNHFLRATDFTQLPDFPATDAQREEVKTYREQLRNIPEQGNDPSTIVWPVFPSFLK
ncbi:tail fiber assembly protein [Pseudomonas sp. GNP013]